MTRPIARVLALLEILQTGGTRTVADLASRLGVDERTVRRYALHLIELDIPIESVRGRYGGYRLAPGFRMPPLMLTDDEAVATLLGLVVGQRAGLVSTSTVAAESAAAKLQRVLPDKLRRRLDDLLQSTEFTRPSRPVAAPEADVLLSVAEAVRRSQPVAITYESADGRRSERTVHPYGIVAHSGRWYVTGADSASGQDRTFRIDRITEPRILPGRFTTPEAFDPAERVLSGMAHAMYRHRVVVRFQGSADDIRDRLPAALASVRDRPDAGGWIRVEVRVEELHWVPMVLAGVGLPFVVEEPDELRGLLRALAERLIQAAAEPDESAQAD